MKTILSYTRTSAPTEEEEGEGEGEGGRIYND